MTFDEWKTQLISAIRSAGYTAKLEDDDMLLIAYDMEGLTPEEAAAQYIETERQNSKNDD